MDNLIGRPAGLPSVQAVAASGIEALIERHGGAVADLLGAVGIQPAEIGAAGGRLDLHRYCALFEHAARALDVASFGLQFGHLCHRSLLGILGDLAFNSPTVGAALSAMTRYFPVIQDQSTLALRLDGRTACVAYQIRNGRIVLRRQDAELTICSLLAVMRAALGPHWAPTEVHFEHPPPADLRDHEALLGAPVYFTAGANMIRFPVEALAAAMPQADADALPAHESRARRWLPAAPREDFAGLVLQEVRAGLPHAASGLPAVAARLGMAESTIYRRLRAERLHFSDMVRELRHSLAASLLEQPHLPLTEIALLLGYSELSAFSRAFQAWTGHAPSAWRQAACHA